ncbi:hypothetical protein K353_05831 [Kitasatospora sp. SolWspMP-SS2h]|uniref:hypothetical protein n=1 Tax=Kitasatospora sp. SolWspMP-SS2h TaxID=1305729 RepID=UPI000DB90EA5|nr:hypothetical protein [Kitasatospora sp. SolWspMP-SS2h]RAJ32833.1 hypothetical protein K353_05831 [Kitasatospora sp. SolWspMP-SS2h]
MALGVIALAGIILLLVLTVSAACAYFASGSLAARALKGLAVGSGLVLVPMIVILVIPIFALA